MKFLLYIISRFYRQLMLLRSYLYERNFLQSYKAQLPVISVGNISAGGTGKTPLCLFLCRALKEKGYSPVILSRGYKGNYKGVYKVSRDDSFTLCGDEPLLMAQYFDVVLSRNRVEGVKYIEENKLGNLVILDDGLQHLKLKRDIDIVTLDISNPENVDDIAANRVLPYGKLREDRDTAIRRADFLVLSNRMPQSRAKPPPQNILNVISANKIIVKSYFEAKEIVNIHNGTVYQGPKEVVAFCGIANPQGFFTTLASLGYKLIEEIVRPDHHAFSESELNNLKKLYSNYPLVCTEKDAMRIAKDNNQGIYKLVGESKIVPEDAFIVQLTKKLKVH